MGLNSGNIESYIHVDQNKNNYKFNLQKSHLAGNQNKLQKELERKNWEQKILNVIGDCNNSSLLEDDDSIDSLDSPNNLSSNSSY